MSAVVVDVGWVNGLAAIRSLGRAGIPVQAVDHRPWAIGFRSRYAAPVLCPDPAVDESAFADCVRGLDGVFFPTHDAPLNALARAGFRGPFPEWTTLARVQDKPTQLEVARGAGLDVPRTEHPRSQDDAAAAAADIGYPVLVKPGDPVEFKRVHRRQAFRCDTRADLERAYDAAAPFRPMVQELVPGGDDALYSLGSYLDERGEPLGIFCGRKLRQTPPLVGTCRVGEAVWVQEVVDQGLALLRAFDFRGISQVEFKRDPRDGRFKLMEINPRLWQWHGLAAACGVDLPLIAYRHLTGARVGAVSTNGSRRRWAITFQAGESPALQRPPYVDAVFARDDLRPVLTHAARVVRSAFR